MSEQGLGKHDKPQWIQEDRRQISDELEAIGHLPIYKNKKEVHQPKNADIFKGAHPDLQGHLYTYYVHTWANQC